MNVSKKLITVFGSSVPVTGSLDYELAWELGSLLAQANYQVATGGYSGTMAAVSQGASETGGTVIGVTSKQIERSRGTQLNQWVDTEISYETLADRLMHLVSHNDGMIVLPGGLGTLSEFALAWSFLQVGEITPRPLILLGTMWQEVLNTFVRPEYVEAENMALVCMVNSPAEAVEVIENYRETK